MVDYTEMKRILTPVYVRDLKPELRAEYSKELGEIEGNDFVIGYYIPSDQQYAD